MFFLCVFYGTFRAQRGGRRLCVCVCVIKHRYRYDGDMTLPEAFGYEACRIFRDRLESDAHDNFNSMLAAVMNAHLGFR